MKTKKVNVGNVQGLSSYQLAVMSGKFTGSLEEYLDKEQIYYDETVEYVDEAKARMEEIIASLTDNSNVDLSEVIDARKGYTLLGERLNATDSELEIILDRLNNIDPNSVNVDALNPIGSSRNVELRNNGVMIEWRLIGETTWQTLVELDEITPNLQIGNVKVTSDVNNVNASISGTRRNPLLNLTLPKGKDGVDGGSIIDFTINDEGEGIVKVLNSDETIAKDDEGNSYIIPVFGIGTVETLEYNQPAYVTISGTISNPILNFGIPKGKPTKIKNARINENGWLDFDIE